MYCIAARRLERADTTHELANSIIILRGGVFGFPSGIIRQNWNDTENISMVAAQG